jgi:hypothetical protein
MRTIHSWSERDGFKTTNYGGVMTYYHDIRPIINELEHAENIHNLIVAQDDLFVLIAKYRACGYSNWAKSNEAKGIHTWTWGEVRPMLTNTQAEIKDFEKRYICHTETVIETTSNSQDIKAWEIFNLKNTRGKYTRIGIRPIMGKPKKFKIEAGG